MRPVYCTKRRGGYDNSAEEDEEAKLEDGMKFGQKRSALPVIDDDDDAEQHPAGRRSRWDSGSCTTVAS